MKESHQEELEELLAGRLIKQAEAEDFDVEPTVEDDTNPKREGEQTESGSDKMSDSVSTDRDATALPTTMSVAANVDVDLSTALAPTTLPPTFAKVEKSLISLGFFTPSSRRIKDQKIKRIRSEERR